MRGQSIHIKRERDTYGVRAAQLGKRMVKVFPAPQRNRFFDKAGKKQSEDTGENGFGYDCIFRSDDLGKSFGSP